MIVRFFHFSNYLRSIFSVIAHIVWFRFVFLSFHFFSADYMYLCVCVYEVRLHRISSINLFTIAILLFGELKISTAYNVNTNTSIKCSVLHKKMHLLHTFNSLNFICYFIISSCKVQFSISAIHFPILILLPHYRLHTRHFTRHLFQSHTQNMHQDWFYLFIIRQKINAVIFA